jgi:hypothetical protein
MATYDHNNIFAKILRGELPSYKVFEDDKVLRFSTSCRARRATRWSFQKPRRAHSRHRAGRSCAPDQDDADDRARRDEGVRGRRPHHPAVQRAGRRPGGVSPACPRHSAQDRRGVKAAGKFQGRPGRAGRAGLKARRRIARLTAPMWRLSSRARARRARSRPAPGARPGPAGCRRASFSASAAAFRAPGLRACGRSAPARFARAC